MKAAVLSAFGLKAVLHWFVASYEALGEPVIHHLPMKDRLARYGL